jgi:hypothetical protein
VRSIRRPHNYLPLLAGMAAMVGGLAFVAMSINL